jgi:hypothetical protein
VSPLLHIGSFSEVARRTTISGRHTSGSPTKPQAARPSARPNQIYVTFVAENARQPRPSTALYPRACPTRKAIREIREKMLLASRPRRRNDSKKPPLGLRSATALILAGQQSPRLLKA